MFGGAGNDLLKGGLGNDIYRFGRGDGQDTIQQDDPGVGRVDALVFDANVAPSEVTLATDGYSLFLSVNGTADRVRVADFFYQNGTNHSYRLDEVRFADGTVWTTSTIRLKLLEGTAGNDTIYGYSDSDDVINGLGGNDNIAGYAGNDTISGMKTRDCLAALGRAHRRRACLT